MADEVALKKREQGAYAGFAKNLQEMSLKKQEEAALEQDVGSDAISLLEEYQYFRPKGFLDALHPVNQTLKKAHALVDAGKVVMTHIELGIENEAGELVARAGFHFLELSYRELMLEFNRDRVIYAQCPSWDCNYKEKRLAKSSTGKASCEHILAAVIMLQEFLEENHIGDNTNAAGLELLDRFQTGGQPKAGGGNAVGKPLHLEAELEKRDGRFSAGFRVGTEKMFKIRNIPNFVEACRRKETQIFGKSTEIYLDERLFDGESKRWWNYLEHIAEQNEENRRKIDAYYKNYYYNVANPFEIKGGFALYGRDFDSFFEKIGKNEITYIDKDAEGTGKKSKLRGRDKELRIFLKLAEMLDEDGTVDGVRLTGDVPELVRGEEYAYFVDSEYINRVSMENFDNLNSLAQSGSQGKLDVVIGRRNIGEFVHKILPKLREIVDVEGEITDRLALYIPPAPEYTFYLDAEGSQIFCRAEVAYGKAVYSLTEYVAENPVRVMEQQHRDMVSERQVMGYLLHFMNNIDADYDMFYMERDDGLCFEFLDYGLEGLMEYGEVQTTENFRRLRVRRHTKFTMGVSVNSSIMDLEITSDGLTEEELVEILFHYKKKRKFVKLKNGEFLKIDENESIAELAAMMEALQVSPKEFVHGKMQIPAYRALYLDKMLEQNEDIYANRSRQFKKLIKEFKTISDADFDVPKNLKKIMRKYQTTGYRWLRTLASHGFGGILADEMGLGKTLQAIAVMEAEINEQDEQETMGFQAVSEQNLPAIPEENGMGRGELAATLEQLEGTAGSRRTSMVVCPASLVYNWLEELAKYAPDLHTAAIAGPKSERGALIERSTDFDVLVTSYDLLKRDIAEYEGKQFRYVIIDEAQYIKNHNTAAAKSVKLLDAQTRFALTGTPIENRLSELWSIFDFLMPGFLFGYDQFRTNFEVPIVKGEDDEVSIQLRKMVTPFILRRQKSEVLRDLPEKLEEVRFAGMDKKQQKIYDAQVLKIKKRISGQNEEQFKRNKIEILSELMKIRQICCDPSLFLENYDGESAKRESCMDLVDNVVEGGHKALIFSQFTSMLSLLEEDLEKRGIPYYKITGQTPKEKRIELVRSYNENDVPIFLISLKAGGTGLNLTGADVVIHYDPWWNLAVQNQATDRAHRIGQTKIVTVYKLILKGTIEEKILEMQEKKKKLAEDILSDEKVSSASISREELLELLDL